MAKKTKIAAGAEARAAFPRLAAWWDAAKLHGVIYARPDRSRSNMSGTVLLWTIRENGDPSVFTNGKRLPNGYELAVCWPYLDGDACAKRLGFSLKARAFKVGGCGFDRVHHVVSNIAYLMDETERFEPRIETLNAPE